ncbi:MAG: helix-turn-helix domain-containing protein, partial [Nocardioidaceae bacterium]
MDVREPLTTGEAAALLGCSRQHVVDMCMRDGLPFVWVGKHRRVPRVAVEGLLPRWAELTREQERSLWLHRAVCTELLADPELILTQVQENLRRWREKHRADGMTVR